MRGLNERYPLLRLPNFPLRRVSVASRLKNEESTDFTSVPSFFYFAMALRLRGLPRITVRGRCVQVEKWAAWNVLMLNRCYPVFWAALVGRHDLMPPL